MHCSICFVLVFANASGVIPCLFESRSKAAEAFLLVVFCEIIVAIKVLNGFSADLVHVGTLRALFSI